MISIMSLSLFLCPSFLTLGRVWRSASLCCSHSKVWSKYPISADEQRIFFKSCPEFQCNGSCNSCVGWWFELYPSIILSILLIYLNGSRITCYTVCVPLVLFVRFIIYLTLFAISCRCQRKWETIVTCMWESFSHQCSTVRRIPTTESHFWR